MKKILRNNTSFFGLTLTLSLIALLTSCSLFSERTVSPDTLTPAAAVEKKSDEISIMTFNVENMFDSIHDEGVDDYTYLPLSEKKRSPEAYQACSKVRGYFYKQECFEKNWDSAAVDFKLSQVAQVIKYPDKGNGPDIILMAEVENKNVLNLLFNGKLKNQGYQTLAILKGPDPRGINTAVVSKFPLASEPILHIIPFKLDKDLEASAKRTRGILEATLKLPNGKQLTVLAAHFPSQGGPTILRKQAMEYMTKLMTDYAGQGRAVIAGGDLNTTQEEDESYGYFKNILSQGGDVSHLVGCFKCKGTHNYRGSWSFLDILAFGKNIKNAGLELIPTSIEVVRSPIQTKFDGTPVRFDEKKHQGVSDHFPLYARLKVLK